jgi:hypothetical protein
VLALNATNLLAAWEQGVSQHPLQRAITLLNLAWPQKSADDWAGVRVGERDLQLLQLREQLFGSKLESTASCPKCGSDLELTFTADDLQVTRTEPLSSEWMSLVSDDYEIDYRLPTTTDLLAITSGPDQALQLLLERCVQARHQGIRVPATVVPETVIEQVGRNMADADPYADIRIALSCANCSHQWSMLFDVLSYFWSEIEDWAGRLFRDVHLLASAYGWSERDIIGMSARRRRLYLELANA